MFTIIKFNYEVNKELITELFCINKEKPMTMCYGKCYLKDQLEKTKEEKENKGIQSSEIVQIVESFYHFTPKERLPKDSLIIYSFYKNQYSYLNTSPVFHPPQTIC